MVNYPRHVIVQSCYIQDMNRVAMTIELDRQDAMGSSNMTHVHKESLCFCVCLCSVGFVFICICTFCVFHIGLNGTKSRGGWPTRPWQPVAAPAVASVSSERSPLAVLTRGLLLNVLRAGGYHKFLVVALATLKRSPRPQKCYELQCFFVLNSEMT